MRRSTSRRNGNRADEPKGVIRAVGYVRCSDEGQSVSDFNTLDNQKSFISQHVAYMSATADNPWELSRFYVDDGFSGKNTDRPALTDLLNDVAMGKVDVIVVYRLDRISRCLADFFRLDAMFQENGASLVSVKEQFDTSNAVGRLIRNVLLSFAEMEREMISERTRDKMYAEAKQGRWTGGVVPFGYVVQDRRLVPNPEEAPVVSLVFAKFSETRSLARTRDFLNALGHRTGIRQTKNGPRGGCEWSVQLVDSLLRNPVYKGTKAYGHVEVRNNHEPLVVPELWEMVNAAMPSNSRMGDSDVDHVYLLQGLVRCPHCGGRMTTHYVRHRDNHSRPRDYTPYYQCQRPRKYAGKGKCPVQRYNADKLENAILKDVETLTVEPEALAAALRLMEPMDGNQDRQRRISEIRAALKDIEPRMGRLVDAIEGGAGLVTLEKRLRELERQSQELMAELMLLEAEERQTDRGIADVDDARSVLRELGLWLRKATREEKREILALMVEEVEAVDKKAVQVTYAVPSAPLPEDLGSNLCQHWLPGVDSNHEPSG